MNSLHTTIIRNRLLLLFYYLNQTRRHFWFSLITIFFWMVRKNNIRLLVDHRSSSRKFHQIRWCAMCQALAFVLSFFLHRNWLTRIISKLLVLNLLLNAHFNCPTIISIQSIDFHWIFKGIHYILSLLKWLKWRKSIQLKLLFDVCIDYNQ